MTCITYEPYGSYHDDRPAEEREEQHRTRDDREPKVLVKNKEKYTNDIDRQTAETD